jgi:NAD(P)-dependent dehydrogenase (short-subunit alcohol dehydrogenase family)
MMKSTENLVVLITGATDGIGRGVAEKFAAMGSTVLLHGRSAARLADTEAAIKSKINNARLETFIADLSSLDDVRRLASDISGQNDGLDILINNAGLGRGPRGNQQREECSDGHELRFQVNHLAPFLLTHILLPLLRKNAPGRVVNVASASQDAIDFGDVMLERSYDGTRAYSQSKLAMVMATIEWARRLNPNEMTVNALHPGSLLDTKLVREAWGRASGPIEIGIESEYFLATSPELTGTSGQYFDEKDVSKAHPQAYEESARKRLWQLSETLTGITVD